MSQNAQSKRSKAYRRCAVMIVGSVLLFGVGRQLLRILGENREARLQSRLSVYREHGQAVSVSELGSSFPAIEEGQNLIPLFEDEFNRRLAYLLCEDGKRDRRHVPFVDRNGGGPCEWTFESYGRGRSYVARNTEWLAVVGRFGSYQTFACKDYEPCTYFAEVRVSFVGVLEHAVSCLCLQAVLAAQYGEHDESLVRLKAAHNLLRTLLDEPFLSRAVTAHLCDELVAEAVYVIAVKELCPKERLDEYLPLCEPLTDSALRKGFAVERLVGLDFYYAYKAGYHDDVDPFSLCYLQSYPLFMAVGKVMEFLDHMDVCETIFDVPPPECFDVARRLNYERIVKGKQNALMYLTPPVYAVLRSYHKSSDRVNQVAEVLEAAIASENVVMHEGDVPLAVRKGQAADAGGVLGAEENVPAPN